MAMAVVEAVMVEAERGAQAMAAAERALETESALVADVMDVVEMGTAARLVVTEFRKLPEL